MRTREIIREARKDGAEAGRNAASWAYDGNTGDAWYVRVLAGLEEGDPEVLDSLRVPNLSGEWADDPTPQSIANDYGIPDRADLDQDEQDSLTDEACEAWTTAAEDAFWHELERVCRAQVKP